MASQTETQSNQRHLCQHDPRNGITNKSPSNQRHLCQHMEKWSRPPHPRPSTPFGSTLQTTCHPRSRHTERPQFEVKSSMSIARVGCGNFAWSMCTNPSNLVNTDISSQKKTILCANIMSEWRLVSGFALPHACGRPKRSQITFSRSFPIELPLRNVRSSRTGAVLRVPNVHLHLNLTHGAWQHSVRLPQKLALPSVNLRFVQEHVATFHCVVTCLKLKFRHHFTRALRYLCDDVSSWSLDQTGKKPHKITTSNGVASYRKKLKRRENCTTILVTSNNCAPQPSKCQK